MPSQITQATASTNAICLTINEQLQDGRGVAVYGEEYGALAGKKVFVDYALKGEKVLAVLDKSHKRFDEASTIEVLQASDERATPICEHFGVCGGCQLQHWQADKQIVFKAQVLEQLLSRQGVHADNWLPSLTGATYGYRRKARLGVRYLARQDELIMGFRQKNSNTLADIATCPILHASIADELSALRTCLASLDNKGNITHLEIASGEPIETASETVAVVIRHLRRFNQADLAKLQAFFGHRRWQLYLEGNNKVIHQLKEGQKPVVVKKHKVGGLVYHVPAFALSYRFFVQDFTQINYGINEQMLMQVYQLLQLQAGERVLDLFCGLGNISLMLARAVGKTGQVVGVEGSAAMTIRATNNARANGIDNAVFYTKDLTQDLSAEDWARTARFDAIVLDPPRAGAWEVVQYLPKFAAKRIVYISCDPATLARDSRILLDNGYCLHTAGVMDMFCHTAHVESVALFVQVS